MLGCVGNRLHYVINEDWKAGIHPNLRRKIKVLGFLVCFFCFFCHGPNQQEAKLGTTKHFLIDGQAEKYVT